MIGLIEMIREQTRSEYRFSDDWRPVPRAQLKIDPAAWAWPISRCYYRLLDTCPLRIPHAQQHSAGQK